MTNRIDVVYAKNETSHYDCSNWVQSMTKIRQDNDMIDCTSVVYEKNETEQS